MRHIFYGSESAPQCLNCGAEAGERHYPNCPCNDPDYDGDEPWADGDDADD